MQPSPQFFRDTLLATIPLNRSISTAFPDVVMRINEKKLHMFELTFCSTTEECIYLLPMLCAN